MLRSTCNQPSNIEHVSDFGSSNLLDNLDKDDDMRDLFRDAYALGAENIEDFTDTEVEIGLPEGSTYTGPTHHEEPIHPANDGTAQYQNLIRDADQELYPGCKNFSKISFLLHLFHLKCMNGWSGKSFTMLLQLLNDAFP